MGNTAKIALVLIGIAALGGGGYYFNEQRVCRGLEEDYLNSVADIRGNIAIASILPRSELKDLQDLQIKSAALSLERIYSRCGDRAGKTASRKGQDLLIGGL